MKTLTPKADLRRSELLLEVAEVTGAQLIKTAGIPQDKAVEVGNAIADFLVDHWKGQTIYIPCGWRFKSRERDKEIHRRLTRGNANELAAEFGLSIVRIYQIVRRVNAERREKLPTPAVKLKADKTSINSRKITF